MSDRPLNHRPFFALSVIWGSLFLAFVVVMGPSAANLDLSELVTPPQSDETDAHDLALKRAEAMAEARRQAALALPPIPPSAAPRVEVRTLGR